MLRSWCHWEADSAWANMSAHYYRTAHSSDASWVKFGHYHSIILYNLYYISVFVCAFKGFSMSASHCPSRSCAVLAGYVRMHHRCGFGSKPDTLVKVRASKLIMPAALQKGSTFSHTHMRSCQCALMGKHSLSNPLLLKTRWSKW